MKSTHLAVALLIGAFALVVTAHDAAAQKRPAQPVIVTPPTPPTPSPSITQI